ncbi:hypothetical protein C0992_001549 [Termitomyces sp. T32_za158]|nr:hypothetical protein C0992_001549 [Termitomyces sp. T32_za158]
MPTSSRTRPPQYSLTSHRTEEHRRDRRARAAQAATVVDGDGANTRDGDKDEGPIINALRKRSIRRT